MTRLGLLGSLSSCWVSDVPFADGFDTALEPALLQLRRGPIQHLRPGIAGASGHA